MQLSDEAVTAIEIWAKGFNALIEDLIAQRNHKLLRELNRQKEQLSTQRRLMLDNEKRYFEAVNKWYVQVQSVNGRNEKLASIDKQGSEKKKRSPKESN